MNSLFNKILPHPILTLILAVVWTLLQNSVSAGMIVFGIILGIIIPLITAAYWPDRPQGFRLGKMTSYAILVMWDIVVANIQVALSGDCLCGTGAWTGDGNGAADQRTINRRPDFGAGYNGDLRHRAHRPSGDIPRVPDLL